MAAETTTNNGSSADSRAALEYALFALALFAAMLAVTTNNANADLWSHVQAGREILARTYSFTAEPFSAVNHEFLAQLLLALAADFLGAVPLVVLKTLVAVAILLLIVRLGLRRGAGLAAVAVVALLVSMNLMFHWTLRPELFSYVLFALMLWLLGWCFQGWEGSWKLAPPRDSTTAELIYSLRRLTWLWSLVPLMIIWSNVHGSFVAGYAVLCAYLVLRGIEAISIRGWRAAGLVKRFATMLAATGLATLLNMYGPLLHFSLLIRLPMEFSQWHPLALADPLPQSFGLLLLATAIVLVATRRSRDFTHLVVIALLVWLAIGDQRYIPFLAIAFGLWITPHVDSVLRRCGCAEFRFLRRWDERPVARRLGLAVSCLLAVWIGWRMSGRMSDLTVFRHEYPISAVQYMADKRLKGDLVVTPDWAHYVQAVLGARAPGAPEIRVAVLNSGQQLYGQPNLALIDTREPRTLEIMPPRQNPWVLLYQDDITQLWGLAAIYDEPARTEYIAARERQLSIVRQVGSVTWPASPKRRPYPFVAVR